MGGVYQRAGLWYVRFSWRGREYRESSGSRLKSVATSLLKKRISEVQTSAFTPAGARVTLGEVLALTMSDYQSNGKRSLARLQTLNGHLARIIGADTKADDVPDRIEHYKAQRLEEGAGPATVNRELSALRRGFNLAWRARILATVPPFELFTERNVRTGFPEPEEVERIVGQLDARFRPVARFLASTGWRLGEALRLQWRNVDPKAGVLRLEAHETKGGEVRIYPFSENPQLAALLGERKAATAAWEREHGAIVPWIFWWPGLDAEHRPTALPLHLQSSSRAFAVAARRAGCSYTAHDLRRMVARDLVRAGVHEKVAMELLGHRTRSIFDRYNVTDERDLRAAVRSFAASR
jgi:integrase